jgi:hypothetical protein
MGEEPEVNPEDQRLLINLGTNLQIEIEGTETRFKSTLLGLEPKNFLLIKIPLSEEIIQKLSSNPVIVRYIYKGSIFGFRTSFIQSVDDPLRVAFITYPAEFENFELRSQERYECFLPVQIKIKDFKKNGALLDISEEGLRVAIRDREYKPSFLKKEDPVTIVIRFPESPKEEEFTTLVRRISEEGGRVSLGLVFSDLDMSKKSLVTKFVNELREFRF